MEKEFKLHFFNAFLILFLLVSCTKDYNPVLSKDEVDSKLVGEWYLLDSLSNTIPAPSFSFYGMQITSDKKINSLGVEINTGKIKIFDNHRYSSLLKANEGKLVIEYFAPPGMTTDTMNYKIENNKLIVWNQYYSNIYTKTELNFQLFNPTDCNLSVNVDSISNENLKVYYNPSGYISKVTESELKLISFIKGYEINISIDSFNGTGTYEIPYKKGELIYFGGDYISIYYSDSLLVGSITIDQYDESNNVCSGTFNFNATFFEPYINQTFIYELEKGTFSVPIYK